VVTGPYCPSLQCLCQSNVISSIVLEAPSLCNYADLLTKQQRPSRRRRGNHLRHTRVCIFGGKALILWFACFTAQTKAPRRGLRHGWETAWTSLPFCDHASLPSLRTIPPRTVLRPTTLPYFCRPSSKSIHLSLPSNRTASGH
jgi:hypothetical protein